MNEKVLLFCEISVEDMLPEIKLLTFDDRLGKAVQKEKMNLIQSAGLDRAIRVRI